MMGWLGHTASASLSGTWLLSASASTTATLHWFQVGWHLAAIVIKFKLLFCQCRRLSYNFDLAAWGCFCRFSGQSSSFNLKLQVLLQQPSIEVEHWQSFCFHCTHCQCQWLVWIWRTKREPRSTSNPIDLFVVFSFDKTTWIHAFISEHCITKMLACQTTSTTTSSLCTGPPLLWHSS